MAKCKSCGYPYVPYKGKHDGIDQWGICPNCGYNNWRKKNWVDSVNQGFRDLFKVIIGFFILWVIVKCNS